MERSPRATALRARIPAPIITDGLEVFVQLVIAAITTWPWSSSKLSPSSVTAVGRVAALSVAPRAAPRGAAGAAAAAASGAWPGAPLAGGSEAG